jgi:hypothetical protein
VHFDLRLEKICAFLPAFETLHAGDGLDEEVWPGWNELEETTESFEGFFVLF